MGSQRVRCNWVTFTFTFPGGSDSKESACDVEVLGLIPGLGISPGEGNSNPLQYSCLENPTDRGAWWATVHGVAELDKTELLTDQIFLSNKGPLMKIFCLILRDFGEIYELFLPLFLWIFFLFLSISSSFWDSHYMYVGMIDGVQQVPEILSFSFILFAFLFLSLDNLSWPTFRVAGSFFCLQ